MLSLDQRQRIARAGGNAQSILLVPIFTHTAQLRGRTEYLNILSYRGASAIETWLYNPGGGMNHFVETTTDKHWLYQLTIRKNQLGIDIYPMTEGLSPAKAVFSPKSRHYRVTIPNTMLPLADWTHVVVQSASGIAAQSASALVQNPLPQIWLNGVQMTVAASVSPVGRFKVSAIGGVMQYPDSLSTLKHMRLYGRLMSPTEIWDNANNNCFMPDAFDNLWYRFNIPAAGGPTTIAATSTVETRCTPVYPDHTLRTTYAYNSTNQVVIQNSPDGGMNRFWYDLLSRLRISQNDKQGPNHDFSYTNYDVLGRIVEVGQKATGGGITSAPDYLDDITIQNFNTAGVNSQITHTYYDVQPTAGGGIHALTQNNLRKRVVLSTYKEHQADTVKHATYYNYDLDGNVKTLYQQIAGLGIKQIDYEYDLISGKVNFVRYQEGKKDAYYYQYEYDAENRLTDGWSGIKAIVDTSGISELLTDFKKQDAHYQYYLHGPLARVELGDQYTKVQGIDYAYTLQGWIKGVNGTNLNPDREMGKDGRGLTNNNNIARDAYGYSLGYYAGDYKPIGGSTAGAFGTTYAASTGDITGQSLYNSNISNSTLAMGPFKNGAPVGYTYHYDQLNRLKVMRQHIGLSGSTWNHSSIRQAYAENMTYDGNGNILAYNRHGADTLGLGKAMDSLKYSYQYDSNGKLVNNQLHQVQDVVPDANSYTDDLKNQTDAANYRYDAIGNLIHDTQAGIDTINWTLYGKIRNIVKGGNTISYTYNTDGQRVSKTASGLTTYYVRDAQGNTLALYDNAGSHSNWREQHLYGSSRLGIWTPNVNLATANAAMVYDTVGRKFFELNNHLGNVLATITDKRVQVNAGTAVDYYIADVATAQDYYPFGMLQPNRQFTANNTTYRYGFNGKENDNEVKGEGNQQDYGMRIYDPRLGKFLSVDPLTKNFPWYTPYQFAGNKPTIAIDLDGGEPMEIIHFLANIVTAKQTAQLLITKANVTNQKAKDAIMFGFGLNNGIASGFDAIGLVEQYKPYQIEAIKQLFSMRYDTFLQGDRSFSSFKKLFPALRIAEDTYTGIMVAIAEAAAGDRYVQGQLTGMVLTVIFTEGEAAETEGAAILKRLHTAEGTVAAEILEEVVPKPRLPQDKALGANKKAPRAMDPTNRTVGRSANQNAAVAKRVAELREMGATDIRVNQTQVNADEVQVGVNRPDLQYTLDGRHYEEYDRTSSNRGPTHEARIKANDPKAKSVKLKTVD